MKRVLLRSGEIEIDPVCRTIARAGQALQPPRKVFDLVLFLVQCRDGVVARESIEREIWPEIRVSKASLRWLLKEVRRYLGDSGTEQRYIETSRGYGLRWVADVEVIECPSDSPSDLGSSPHVFSSRRLDDDVPRAASSASVDCTELIKFAEHQVNAGKFVEAGDLLRQAAELADRFADLEGSDG